ncbi:MAG: PH domain-containing protein [Christensenellales bacterium]
MGSAGISLLCLFSAFCWYFTAGVGMGDYFLMLARGYGAKSRIYIRYDKIQYLKLKQNFLARACHIQSGEAYVLAASTNRVQPIPYFPEDLAEKLKNHTLAPNRHHKVY